MKTIYKYPIPAETNQFAITMPRGARVLSFQIQHGVPCIWALVDTEEPVEAKNFYLVGTGHPFIFNLDYVRFIGTAQLMNGDLLLHLFERV
ncbi:hypothetical protein ES703_98159 [subsurface metagenome]